MKDFRDSSVNGVDVEQTDAPVITRAVEAPGMVPVASTLDAIVEAAFTAHAGQLKAFALAAVRDDDAADDLVQETFVRFVRHLRSASLPDNVPGWLHRVCANLIISRGRRLSVAGRKSSQLIDRSVAPSPEERVIRRDEGARLRDAIGQLPTDARVALLMAAAGYSMQDIGEAIGRSANATSTYVCRARIRLRELLSSSAEGES